MQRIRISERESTRTCAVSAYIESEWLKSKRSFVRKMVVLMPLVTVVLALFMMNGTYARELAYNWWYLLFLPFTVAYVAGHLVSADRKKNFHGLWGIVQKKREAGYAKVVAGGLLVLGANVVFMVLIALLGGVADGAQVVESQGVGFGNVRGLGLDENLLAGVLLTVTFVWQIPLFMLITMKTNTMISVVLSVFFNFGIACLCAVGSFWWVPFAIPARLMCHVLGILPNGLMAEAGAYVGISEGGFPIVLSGVLITAVLCVVMTGVLGKAFDRQEV